MDQDQIAIQSLWWAKTQTIATVVGLGIFLFNIGALIHDRIIRLKALDPAKRASDQEEMSYFRVPKLSWWRAFQGYTTTTPRVTTLRGLVEAGDNYLWSSAALDHLQSAHGNLSWVPLYEAVYSQTAKFHDKKDSRLAEAIKEPTTLLALNCSREGLSGTGNERFRLLDDQQLVNCLRHLDKTKDLTLEKHLRQIKKRTCFSCKCAGAKGAPCIECSREEIVALALVLGVSLKINDYTQNVSGIGPFGTGFDITQDNGVWKLELIHGSRIPRHAASRGSGYSVLFAKHLAFGSLPFAENKYWVHAVYVNPGVLNAIKRGHAIKDGKSFGGRPLQVLRSLPAAKQIDAFYHTEDSNLEGEKLGGIFYSNGDPVIVQNEATKSTVSANWCRAVVGIAFGGLVPQASRDLAAAVAFTVGVEAIGDAVGDVVDALEMLVNALHNCAPVANVFGDYIAERCEEMQSVDYIQYATPSRYDTQEAAAVFARYMNLLERMAAISGKRPDNIYEKACTLVSGVYKEVILRGRQKNLANLSRNLVQQLTQFTTQCRPNRYIKPSLEDCAIVVWSILVVWASRVPHGESKDFRDEVLEHGETDDIPRTRRAVPLADLPQLVAFS